MAQIINQNTETVAIDSLRPHPRNVNQGDLGAIHESITANGFYGNVVAQRSTGHIIVGSHRWQAAQQAGLTEIPVTWVDVDDDAALRIMLADNRTARLGSDDDAALAELLKELAEDGGLEGTGFDGDDLDALLAEVADPEWSDGENERLENRKSAAFVRPVIAVADTALLEGALKATGNPNRAEALLDICRSYLEKR